MLGARQHDCLQLFIHRLRYACIPHHTTKILVGHGDGTVHQVAKGIGQIGVHTLYHQLPGDDTVILERHLMQYEVTHRIYAEEINQVIGIQHISLGLAHLAIALQQPRMSEYLLRKRQIQRHQEDRPVNRMETDDILTDQVQVCRPVFLKQFTAVAVTVIADTCDIVGQCIQPYIYHMLRIKVDRNAPFEGCSGYTQILQTRQQEVVHHLILSGYRLDKLRMCIDMLDQTVCIFAHLEEISLFLRRLYLTSAVRAFAVYQLGLGPEGLAGSTVQSLIRALVNIALVVQLFEDLLYLLLMILISGTDEFVIGSIHQIPDTS